MSLYEERLGRAKAIRAAGGLEEAVAAGTLPRTLDLSLSEGIVLGLLRQGVRKYVGVFGHGSTDLGEALRPYADEGVVKVFDVRSEIEASHAAAALRWQYGETAAVFTSIGPGALQALSASLAPLSDGLGLYYLFGDETTRDEGYNMQQIPAPAQASFLKLASAMGPAYSLHTAEALGSALKRGASAVFSKVKPSPFYLFLPMNEQSRVMEGFNLDSLPAAPSIAVSAPAFDEALDEAVALIAAADRVAVKTGNGARGLDPGLLAEFLERADAAYVHGPSIPGLLPGPHPRNMTVGGSKGSISGNAAMAAADLVVTIGARAVCQWDSSGTAWKNAKRFVAINADPADATHYTRTLPLVGDAGATLERLVARMRAAGLSKGAAPSAWSAECAAWRARWDDLVRGRASEPPRADPTFGRPALTQVAAVAETVAFARAIRAVKYFDAGDVQANGFQLVEDDAPGRTFTDTGASYMGFAACGILSSAFADRPEYPIAFTGDGSFMMNPQVLIDAARYGLRGMIVLFDNRRMAAIASLQRAQYGVEFKTCDGVAVDYVAMARSVAGVGAFFAGFDRAGLRAALESARAFDGPALVHVPVYSGPDEEGGLGAYGDWNVGAWCERVQLEKTRLGL
ncbi:MAG: thiamine pyrophosphate-binding protein [Spirochaetes bacterium]|nr:thiamine pyrophosphate-binding protein [Spirochaetota bacterium]MBU1080659.1 thiamine pyrophosphate-binding protein [Spirochaetota bacterium]